MIILPVCLAQGYMCRHCPTAEMRRALRRFRAGRRVRSRALENHLRERDLVFKRLSAS